MTLLEPERIASMQSLLRPGDILFDIGAEKGTQSVLYADIVGASNMCLFEPEPTVWPNIRNNFEEAELSTPMHCCVGLVSNVTVGLIEFASGCWPTCAYGDPTTYRTFRYIHEHADTTGQITIDDWVAREHVSPTAVAIDCEGAEYVVLLGMGSTLVKHRPLVWCSIHPDLMMKDYNQSPDALLAYMKGLNYSAELLAVDHERHMLFKPL